MNKRIDIYKNQIKPKQANKKPKPPDFVSFITEIFMALLLKIDSACKRYVGTLGKHCESMLTVCPAESDNCLLCWKPQTWLKTTGSVYGAHMLAYLSAG